MTRFTGAERFRLIDLGVLPDQEAQDTRNQKLLKAQEISFDQVWPGQNPWGIQGAVLYNHWAGPDCRWYLRHNDGAIQQIQVTR
ncbi:MAG: hypothetical protein VKK03_02825 [Synechococcus sp.]|nr:hypothetical protein [Synechococcus sp.]